MLEDPLGVVTDSVEENTTEEAPKDHPVTAVTEPEEADTTSTGSEEAELFSRGGSVPLVVEDAMTKYLRWRLHLGVQRISRSGSTARPRVWVPVGTFMESIFVMGWESAHQYIL